MRSRAAPSIGFTILAAALLAAAPEAAEKPIERGTLPNGVTLILQDRPGCGTYALQILARGGSLEDPDDLFGATSLLSRMLLRGTASRGGAQIALDVERTGSSFGPVAGALGAGLLASGPARGFPAVLELLAEAALRPRLDSADLRREIALERQSLRTSLDDPAASLGRAAMPLILGRHPLGRVADLATYLDRVDVEAVRRIHAARFTGRRLVVVIVGEIDTKSARARCRAAFGRLAEGSPAPHPPPGPEPLRHETRVRVRRRTPQPGLLVGLPTQGMREEDEAAMDLLVHILAGFQERLSVLIREERGWAYWLSALDWRHPGAGVFGIVTAVPKRRLEETARIIREEMDRIAAAAPAPDEVERARRYLATARARAWQRSASRAALLAGRELRGMAPLDLEGYRARIAAVPPEAIRDLARRLLGTSAPAVVTLY